MLKYLSKCFAYAVTSNKNNPIQLKSDLLNVTDHAYGNHDKCGEWCHYKDDPENYKHKGLPNGEDLKNKDLKGVLANIFARYGEFTT